ncbi:MAG: hypothetical protein VXY19_01485 [Bacteroidota bacterium]|nr:hypothetical protein [Bacteroidota bacterium]|tara:strand:- start:1444 stop:2085 length:642 start_codon:yes stop_codon:yes gene_type:complete
MSNKIFQELCRIAKEILENSDESNFQKVYDQTLSLLEQLILIKNSEGFSEDFWLELKSKYDMEIDFIHVNEKGVIDEDFSDSLSQSRNSTIETNKETPDTKNYEAEIEISSNLDLDNKIKEDSTPQKELIKERLNDRFSKGLQIDLNDRLAFIKHLFNKNTNDYQRAISQISTFQDWNQAKAFILEMVKPDYDNWKGKELYEERFFKIIENNF